MAKNSPISKIVIIESFFISIALLIISYPSESQAENACNNASMPFHWPNAAFKNIVEKDIKIPTIAIPTDADITSFIIPRIVVPAPFKDIAHPSNSHDNNISGNIIKSIVNFTKTSNKYNGIGNSAVTNIPITTRPKANNNRFGNIGTLKGAINAYSGSNDIFINTQPTVIPAPVN